MRWDILFSDLADTFDSLQAEDPIQSDAEGLSSRTSDPLWLSLRQAAHARQPVSVCFVSGAQHLMTVRSIGETWFQAITAHPPVRGVLVSRLAVEAVRIPAIRYLDLPPVRGLPFSEVLGVWARRGEAVEVHTTTARWAGRLSRVGESSVELTSETEGELTVLAMAAIHAVWSVSRERWD